ncbi:MAG TPA: porin [Rhizomicrobium sp.]|jgi:phosphate-selective porin OprO/OprP
MVRFSVSLFVGAAWIAFSAPAQAQAQKSPQTSPDPRASQDSRVRVLEQRLRDVERQLAEIKAAGARNDASAPLADLKRSTSDQYKDLSDRLDNRPVARLDDGRFSIASRNGDFTLSLRSLVQFDYGYFAQGKNPASVDLNSGSNFRRAQIGLVGTAWRDWSYNFTYDFGGNGVEKSGYIYYAYLQYDGLKPFAIRAGAMTPFLAIEDATGSADLLFLERPSSIDIARNIAGAPGREGVEAYVQGDTYLLSLAYTGKKTTDAATFDAQQALVARASWLAVSNSDVKWILDADVTHVFRLADTAPNTTAPNTFSFSNGPELAVDASKTINTGNIDAGKVTQYGFETGATYAGFYGQGGWFHYSITRHTSLPNPDFSGWYVQAAYSLSGEERAYDPTTASFRGLRPVHPLGTRGGLGAWELTARYSNMDLDFMPFAATAAGGIAGGQQNVWNVGVNWYPTNGLRFIVDYYNIHVDHVNAPANDISADAIGIRSQVSF